MTAVSWRGWSFVEGGTRVFDDNGVQVVAKVPTEETGYLISAAPDLLRALTEMVALFGEPNDGMESSIVAQARSALAKARGES